MQFTRVDVFLYEWAANTIDIVSFSRYAIGNPKFMR